MKFMVDAQLPRRLAQWLTAAGHDARHTLELPNGNATPDDVLRALANDEDRVLITKDADFVDTSFLRREPARLLLVSTGNIPNRELEALFAAHLDTVVATLTANAFVEVDRAGLTIRS